MKLSKRRNKNTTFEVFILYFCVSVSYIKVIKALKKIDSMHNIMLRNKFVAIFLLSLLSIAFISAQNVPYETVVENGQTYYKYSVKPGEGLYSISKTFSTTVAEILRHNPGADAALKVGQILLIPIKGEVTQSSQASRQTPNSSDQNNTFKHTVTRGETVFGISRMYNTTVEEIYRYNPGTQNGITENQVLTIPQRRVVSNVKEENYRYHTILPKETLYAVSRTYSLSPEDIIRANPGLSVETFQIGKTIRIPFFESNETFTPYQNQVTNVTHVVKRGETLYSISRVYNVSVSEIERANPMLSNSKLRANMELVIPVKRTQLDGEDALRAENEANRLLSATKPSLKVDVLKVGLLLPFLDETSKGHLRLQEFYEGFLLAVEKLKNERTNIELYVFEIGKGNNTRKLESLLGTLEMQSLDLVIGGANDAQIKVLSDFSKAHNVKYVVPFSVSNTEVLNNFNIFQANSPQNSTHIKVSNFFINSFKKSNIVFVNGGKNDKSDFISQLQTDLRKNNIKYESVSLTSALSTTILSMLSSAKENIIVPTSSDSETLKSVIGELKKVQESNSTYTFRLFGYPDWKTFDIAITNELHQFNTQIYATFHYDETDAATRQFNEAFRKWYGRDLMDLYPRYGIWGYDIGLYFMTALKQYGTQFEQNIHRVRVNTLQHAFHFERANNWGGFINSALYIIQYTPDGRVQKWDKSL